MLDSAVEGEAEAVKKSHFDSQHRMLDVALTLSQIPE